ncbi:hypothetical protein RRG08_066798 [Elysia crispata]|uniref:Uncharacterized protein n=1 Tax=Elysia crispata TaxID=231223 RepID=A0AAE0XPU3_9GAST|nr:hypothetical protein RRG08_066798 [Elysia crispata]
MPFIASGFSDTWPSRSWDTDSLADILTGKTFACRVSEINCTFVRQRRRAPLMGGINFLSRTVLTAPAKSQLHHTCMSC